MGLRVHHLDCATMCPAAGAWLGHGPMVGHCLLVETAAGLVLVDTGFGVADAHRLPLGFRLLARPTLDPARTALGQVQALGYSRDDVRHVVLTHLDLDHAGGLSDFPRAVVHVQRAEHAAALERRGLLARRRYLPEQWAHAPEWSLHGAGTSDWFGFGAVRDLPGLPPEVLLVPLAGHTRGHQAVAVDSERGWLLHVGDLWPHRARLTGEPMPAALEAFERVITTDRPTLLHNQQRVRDLHRDHHAAVRVFCAHDAEEFRALAQPAT